MYVPLRYRPQDQEELLDFVRASSFATLVSHDGVALSASHLPLDLVDRGRLVGHFAKANPHWRAISPERDVLAVFLGPHAYVSPTWYGHANVPTWNYVAVHVTGRPRLIHDVAELRALVDLQVRLREAPERYSVESLPPKLLAAELKGIVGLEIAVSRVEGAFKLSQNRNAADHENVARELDAGLPEERAVAEWMRRTSPHAGEGRGGAQPPEAPPAAK